MLNPPEKKPQPKVTDKFVSGVRVIEKRIARERDLVIAILFLVTGFLMGRL